MPSIPISEELKATIDAAVREGEYADATEYIARLVRQDQKRRAKESLHALLLSGTDSADPDGLSQEAWSALDLEKHRHDPGD